MAQIIEITEKKVDKMSCLVDGMMAMGDRLMHCLENIDSDEDEDDYEDFDPEDFEDMDEETMCSGMRSGYRRGRRSGMRSGMRRGMRSGRRSGYRGVTY